ncbi:MAG: hypothetical protein ACE5GJ_11410 [Gemmatimonadota bacterium]
MSTYTAVATVLVIGVLLTLAAAQTTASVQDGKKFIRWMVVVFLTYVALITFPVLVAF